MDSQVKSCLYLDLRASTYFFCFQFGLVLNIYPDLPRGIVIDGDLGRKVPTLNGIMLGLTAKLLCRAIRVILIQWNVLHTTDLCPGEFLFWSVSAFQEDTCSAISNLDTHAQIDILHILSIYLLIRKV